MSPGVAEKGDTNMRVNILEIVSVPKVVAIESIATLQVIQ